VSTSCSTLHVPYSLTAETDIDDRLRRRLAFGAEKVAEVVEAEVPTEQNDADAVAAEHEAEADPNLVPVHAPESDELTEAKIEAENEKPAPAKKAAAKKPAAKKADAEAADADAAGESADK
jgi:hypothetical protein